MRMRGEYEEMIYLYLANERLIKKETGISKERKKRLKLNNRIIKKNINEIYCSGKFTEMYKELTSSHWRDIEFEFSIGMKESSGEAVMTDKLTELNLPFFQEVSFCQLPFLRFDFYLPTANTVIEVDGIQHFVELEDYYNSHDDFLKQKRHDNMKRSFAYKNNIIYVRFKYSELNKIEEKLRRRFVIT